jgi:SAM-dependent methyltransferase
MNNPRPPDTSFNKHEVEDYERRRYRGWDQRLVDWREKKILEKILDRVGPTSELSLDIPCGYGRFSGYLSRRGRGLVSSDLSFPMVRRSIERDKASGLHYGVVADAKKGLPFQKRAFSVLLSMRFFHHLHRREDREFILREFNAVSSQWIILSFYRRTFFHRIQRRLRRRIKKTKTRIRMISKETLQEEANRAGLKIAEIYPLIRGIHAQHLVLLKKS